MKEFIFKYAGQSYHIPLQHKIINLCGDSATGKTSLINLVEDAKSEGMLVDYISNFDLKDIYINIGINDLEFITNNKNNNKSLVILDEVSEIVDALRLKSKMQLRLIKQQYPSYEEENKIVRKRIKDCIKRINAFMIIITRDTLIDLPLPQDAVVELINSDNGKTHIAQPVCSTKNLRKE